MATTTASITISSGDLTGDALSLSSTATLTKAGTTTGLDQTTGVGRILYGSAGVNTLIAHATYTADKAHKLYIKNPSGTAGENIVITFASQAIGRLYAGDFALIPWNGDTDIKVTTSDANMVVEYLLIFEA